MKLSLNWIKKYVDLPEDLTMEKLAYDLTMCTVEVEEAFDLGASLRGLCIGKILSVSPHPNADKLRICSVDLGDAEPNEIVCGGINLEPGMLVCVAKPGAWVVWHGEGEPVEIKPAKLRGVMSYGMICASDEVGLGDLFPATQHAEIIDLTAFGAKPGTPVAEALGLNDVIIDIDNKSMTNRPDLWGHYGMARELAAIYGRELKPLGEVELPSVSDGLEVKIENAALCPRYTGLVIKNVKSVESPFELKSLIWRVGMRPINLIVDITNYVMLATGQPTHGFDRSHINGAITVRCAKEGEKLQLLDDTVLDLTNQDLVIADDKAPVALAGIMGGKLDSILPETTEIIMEIANFNALSVRKTTQRFGIRTEASSRYEKGIDPQRVDSAVSVAVRMFKKYFPDCVLSGCADNYPAPLAPAKVSVDAGWLNRRLGSELKKGQVAETLSRLGFVTEEKEGCYEVTAPTWRSTGDISLPDDILEEIARLIGYENFDFVPPVITLDKAVNQRKFDTERVLREYLAFRCGMQEIFTYPWIEDMYVNAAGVDKDSMLRLSTPPSPEQANLRSTLVPGILMAVANNLRYFDEFKLFELTPVFFNRDYHSVNSEAEKLPTMERHVAGAFVGSDPRLMFREAKGIMEYMHRYVQVEQLSFAQAEKPVWAEDKLWLNVMADKDVIGCIGLVSQKAAKAAGIKRALAVIFELNVEKLQPLASRQNEFTHLPEYPLADFDLSVIFDEAVSWEQIHSFVEKVELVRDTQFVEEYRGKQVGEGKKSVTFRTWIGSDKGTLTSEQIETATKQIVNKLVKKLSGEVRDA